MNAYVEEEKKFKTEEVTMQNGSKMLRIIALRTIETSRGIVKPGDSGGLIEHKECLSQYGNCWVWYDAKVLNNARVRDDAQIFGTATIMDNAYVYDQVEVGDDAVVMGDAKVMEQAIIYGYAKVCGSSNVLGYAKVYDNAVIGNNAVVKNYATVRGSAKVFGNSMVSSHAIVEGTSKIGGDAEITNNAIITTNDNHDCIRSGRFGINAYIDGKAIDYIVAGPLGSRDDMITVYYTKNGLYVYCGCFNGSVDDFSRAVELTHGSNKKNTHYHDYNNFMRLAISILNHHHAEGLDADKPKYTNHGTLCNTRPNDECECDCATN